jgi:hypothetical protein
LFTDKREEDMIRKQALLGATLSALAILAFVSWGAASSWAQGMMGGSGKMDPPPAQGDPIEKLSRMKEMAADVPRFPPVRGFGEGGVVFFIHSEASDAGIAQVLSLMMGSPVITVPELARTPESLLANVYVFRNGLAGMGPLGFQPDIFDALPGSQGYRPLRRVSMVTWKNPAAARELKSVEELMQAQSKGELGIERTDVVVNMPMLMWPLGRR